MKLREILNVPQFDWSPLLAETMKKIEELAGQHDYDKPKFQGGYCFHLALALFLEGKKQKRNCTIIADGSHAALADDTLGISIDSYGIHQGDSALNARMQRQWSTAKGFIKAVNNGYVTEEQSKMLDVVNLVFS